MKFPPLWRIPLALLVLCLTSLGRCYVNNDVIKFGEQNSLKCPQGSLYILHCEVKCLNAKNRIIHRSCIDEVEARCMGNSKCKYYFDYVVNRKSHNLRNENEIEVEECVESESNEIKTSTTCLLSNSFLLDENYIQYFFFLKNKNEEPITCKDGNINVKSAILHSPFCKVNLKDVTEVLKRQCDNNKECVINPYVLQKDALNEKDQCYINNSYVSLNVVCTKEGEELPGESSQKEKLDDDLDETEGGKYENSLEKKQSGEIADGDSDPESSNAEDELKQINEQVDLIMNSSESFTDRVKKAKTILLSEMNEQAGRKNAIFKLLGEELSKMVQNRYDPAELKDLLEDRYNEMKRSPDQDLYYIYLLDTLDINKMEGVNVTALQDNLAILLNEEMEKLNQVEKTINRLRKVYLSIYKKAKDKEVKDVFDENVDPVLTYDDFAHGNGIISADIFFKYKPNVKPLIFTQPKESDTKGVAKKEYKDLNEIDTLDDYGRKKVIVDMRNGLVETLKKLYYEKNGIFNNLASCIKSYCYKNPLNQNVLSNVLKSNFEGLKENKISDPVAGIVRYLEKVNIQGDSPAGGSSSQVGVAGSDDGSTDGSTDGSVGSAPPLWEKNKRILGKLHALLHLGYQQAYEKELEIEERTEKYSALNEKAKEYNLHHLFSESDKVLKKVSVLTSGKESADEVFGNQASFFDVYKEGEAPTGKSDATSDKDKDTSQTNNEEMKKKENEKEVKGSNSDEQVVDEKEKKNDKDDPDEGYESDKEDGKNAPEEEGKSEEADGINAGSKKEGDTDGGDKDGQLDDVGSNDDENDDDEEDDEEEAEEEAEEATTKVVDSAAKDDKPDEGSNDSTAAGEATTDATDGEVAEPTGADQKDVPVKGEDNEDAGDATDKPTEETVVKGDSEGAVSPPDTEKKGNDGGSFFQGLSTVLLAVLAILALVFLF